MASISMTMPLPAAAKNRLQPPSSDSFFKPLTLKNPKRILPSATTIAKLRIEASFKEKAVSVVSSVAVAASMAVPEVAQAAEGLTPSLKNFLLSIGAGGVVLVVILGAVIAVSNFDPVKRN